MYQKIINKVYYVLKYIITRFGIRLPVHTRRILSKTITLHSKKEINRATCSDNCSKEVRVEVQDT